MICCFTNTPCVINQLDLLSFERTQLGIRDAINQMRERARALATMALLLHDSKRSFQEVKQFETASIRGFQLAASISPKQIKIPRTFTVFAFKVAILRTIVGRERIQTFLGREGITIGRPECLPGVTIFLTGSLRKRRA